MSTIAQIKSLKEYLSRYLRTTPLVETKLGLLKLELLQETGSFKPRGVLSSFKELRPKSVVAVSAGNHGIAVAWAARIFDVPAVIVLPKSANKYRRDKISMYGAKIVVAEDVFEAFKLGDELAKSHTMIHSFEGPSVSLGTATLGDEILDQCPELDAIVVAIGGGGLIAGVSEAIKIRKPDCKVYGVEPIGAASISLSLSKGRPCDLTKIETIADSLAPHRALPHSFSLIQKNVDDVVLISDEEMLEGVKLIKKTLGIDVEPAAAASLMAATGPLASKLSGKRYCSLICGSNCTLSQ